MVDTYNRQLHPDEQQLAKELAKKSGGKYTEKEIADALRWANNRDKNETASSNILVKLDGDTQAGDIYDATSMSLIKQGEQGFLMQDLSKIAPPGDDLMAFIQNNTGDTYSWNTGAWQAIPTPTYDNTRYALVSANGKTFSVPLADCPAAGCTGEGAIAWASAKPEDQAALREYAAALDQEAKRAAAVAGLVATGALAPELAAVLGAGKMAVGGTVGGAFDAAGQLTGGNSEDYRYWQTVGSALTGAFLFPVSGQFLLVDVGLGGVAGAANTGANNWIYGGNNDVLEAVKSNAGFAGLGFVFGKVAGSISSTVLPKYIGGPAPNPNIPILLQTPGKSNPWPDYINNAVNTTISGTPSWGSGLIFQPTGEGKQ